MNGLKGKVALITGGGKGIGRAIALHLAARGVRVVITGRDEKALGETVGEIACAGGKARHLAGDVRDAKHVEAAVAKAVDVFEGIDFVIANANAGQANATDVLCTFSAALPKMKGPGRLIATARGGPSGDEDVLELVRSTAREAEVVAKKITCNAIVPHPDLDPEKAAELVIHLCSTAGDAINGQSLDFISKAV